MIQALASGSKNSSARENVLSPSVKKVCKSGHTKLINAHTNKTIIKDVKLNNYAFEVDSLLRFSKDERVGFINLNTGNIDIAPQYTHAWPFSEGLAGVVVNGKLGFIRTDGSIAIPCTYNYHTLQKQDYFFHYGYCVVADSSDRYGIINQYGEWLLRPQYEKITLCEDYFVASNTGDFNKQISYDGHVIQDCVVENIYDITYDINYKLDNSCYGYIEEDRVVSQEYFKYYVFGRYGLMDKKGHYITPPLYTEMYGFGSDHFRAILQDEHSEVILNTKGQIVSNNK